MRRIGLLGGMSWESSAEYSRLLTVLVRERLGGLASAECLLYSVNFAEIEAMQVEGRWDDAGYRDELRVILVNTDPDHDYEVHRGDRIAQLVIQRVEHARLAI